VTLRGGVCASLNSPHDTTGGIMAFDQSLDWLISVDDHVLEPPNVWVDRVPAKDRDRAPHMVVEGDMEYWIYDGKRFPSSGLSAVAGKSKEEFSPEAVSYAEMRPGCYDAKARLDDMNRAGILASLCFPTLTRFCGQLFMEASDREFGFVCLQAYNDWMLEEWCGAAPGRYIPLVLIPMWDPALAAKEMERCAAKGATAFAFSENPAPLGLPTIHDKDRYWDPVMSTASEAQMVVCMHVGSSSTMPQIAPDSPFMANLAWGAVRTSGAMLAWLFSGMFTRFPGLKIALSEGEIGWMPYFLERAEQVLDKQRFWVQRGVQFMGHATTDVDLNTLDIRGLFRDHVFGCFIDDAHGIASIEEIGVDNVMCETDYPHSDSTWPNCISVVKKQIGHLSPEVQYKILRGNAEKLYRFTPAEIPVLTDA
jgi:predicted TIM-barrel fold metal-dependent hydrolase